VLTLGTYREVKWGGRERKHIYGLRPADSLDSTLVFHNMDRRHVKKET
jgi:hypothetical protein